MPAQVSSSLLLPLVRLMLSCLTVDQLPAVFQVKAASECGSCVRRRPWANKVSAAWPLTAMVLPVEFSQFVFKKSMPRTQLASSTTSPHTWMAAGMVASIFRAAPEHRGAVLQELLAPGGLLGHVGGAGTAASSKGPPREFLAQVWSLISCVFLGGR